MSQTLTVPRLGGTLIIQYTAGSGPPLQYINVTWVTRDQLATWKTRDVQPTWNTRDDNAAWKARQ